MKKKLSNVLISEGFVFGRHGILLRVFLSGVGINGVIRRSTRRGRAPKLAASRSTGLVVPVVPVPAVRSARGMVAKSWFHIYLVGGWDKRPWEGLYS